MGVNVAWWYRVEELRDRASNAEHLEEACDCVDEAFALMDSEGDKEHLVFASLLCVAGDLSMKGEVVESAASLYKRASEVARSHVPLGQDSLARAMRGLGDTDVARGWTDRARERYAESLALLAKSSHPEASALGAEIEEALRALEKK
jgi:response regulator RpfG family c-di-GMP phosphodiesterase